MLTRMYCLVLILVVHIIFSMYVALRLLNVVASESYTRDPLQMKKRKLKEQEKRKQYEAKKAKVDQLTKKRQREERRDRYRDQDKQKKRARKQIDV